MASPQLENGHTRIANEIIEALSRAPLNGAAFRIALYVLRKTYGWQRKVAEITLREIAKMTGLNYRTVQREVKELLECGVLHKELNVEGSSLFGVVKDYETWRLPGISRSGQLTLCGQSTLKDTVNRPQGDRVNRPHSYKESRKKRKIEGSVPGKQRQADSRAFFDPVIALWMDRFKTKPSWSDKHFAQLAALRKRRPDMTPEEFIDRYKTFLNSTDQFWSKQRGSLAYFCGNYDLFVPDVTRAIDEIPDLIPEEDTRRRSKHPFVDASVQIRERYLRENAEEELRAQLSAEPGDGESAVGPPGEQMRAILTSAQSTRAEVKP